MLHRNSLIAICALFCAVAIGAGLFIANLSKQNGLITQQADITSLPTTVAAAAPTPIADQPVIATEPMPTSAPSTALDPVEPTATSQPAPTTSPPTEAATQAANATSSSSEASYIEYTVQKGDLLNNIAKKYNVTTKDILAINQISNADSLTVGQVLRIPKV
jgi:peptidoglycan DL-endopeptidase LytF